MQLSEHAITGLATIICGDGDLKIGKHFMYRSSSRLTAFFANCDLEHRHDGSTRFHWVAGVLRTLNREAASFPDLPSDPLVRVITEVMDESYFEEEELDRQQALEALNKVLSRHSLVVFFDNAGGCNLRHAGTGVSAGQLPTRPRALTQEETAQRERLSTYLNTASEDQFTEVVLVPFFQRLGFHRINSPGHREKMLEFGIDLWMKYQLPTGHWLYFAAQVKRVKIDAKGVSGGNVHEIFNQAGMAMDHPIFDPDLNREVLLDHLFIISAAEITRQAKQWLATKLDREQRRRLIFMERDELLNHAARIVATLPLPTIADDDQIPF